MPIKQNFERLAAYNRWMNRKVYHAAAELGVAELHADMRAFFGSVFGTLNHILVADTIWLKRFCGHPQELQSLQTLHDVGAPSSLSQILHADLEQLDAARRSLDEIIVRMCSEASEDHYAQALRYVTTSGQSFVNEFAILVQHFFNHQTHHRGQVTTLLYQSAIDIGATDLVVMLREQEDNQNPTRPSGTRS